MDLILTNHLEYGRASCKRISVVIPTYNRQKLTTRAINSVACKRPDLIEVVVVDDFGSIPYVHLNDCNVHGISVRVFYSESNQGPGMARSIGVAKANGDVIAFLDSDDVFSDGWLDAVLSESLEIMSASSKSIFIVGKVVGASLIVRVVEFMLRFVPGRLELSFVRLIFIFSNSFHTPSIAVSKNSCFFSDVLRYCEDYYTNALAVFRVDQVKKLDVVACLLDRRQGAAGGESNAQWRMFKGEMQVRCTLLRSSEIHIFYRLLVPIGMLYQIVRSIAMMVWRYLRRCFRGQA